MGYRLRQMGLTYLLPATVVSAVTATEAEQVGHPVNDGYYAVEPVHAAVLTNVSVRLHPIAPACGGKDQPETTVPS